MKKNIPLILFSTTLVIYIIFTFSYIIYKKNNIKMDIIGDKIIKINLYDEYNEQGATAIKNKEDISSFITVKDNIDNTKPGTYQVKYTIEKKEIERTVVVVDNIKPTISLNGEEYLVVKLNTEYKDNKTTATDNIDGDITDKIKINSNVDTSKVGDYKITYTVSDTAGNTVSVDKTVVVRESNSYVRVSIDEQKVYFYKDNELKLKSDMVSGTLDRRDSPKGVFKIYEKNKSTYLVGGGYPVYVNYWMAFKGGVGLHDAPWRNEFGGEIYKTNGSHGCINLPYETAKLIYENTEVGDTVEVY